MPSCPSLLCENRLSVCPSVRPSVCLSHLQATVLHRSRLFFYSRSGLPSYRSETFFCRNRPTVKVTKKHENYYLSHNFWFRCRKMFLIESRIRYVVSVFTYDVPFLRHMTSKKTLICFHFFYFLLLKIISQKLSHRKISLFFPRHLLGYSIWWNNKYSSEQRNDVTKNTSIFDFNM